MSRDRENVIPVHNHRFFRFLYAQENISPHSTILTWGVTFSLSRLGVTLSLSRHNETYFLLTFGKPHDIKPSKIHFFIFLFWRKTMFRKHSLSVSSFYYYAFSNAGSLRGWAGV